MMGFISPMAFKLEPVGSATKIAGVCRSSCPHKPMAAENVSRPMIRLDCAPVIL